jgi:hypothetical protein
MLVANCRRRLTGPLAWAGARRSGLVAPGARTVMAPRHPGPGFPSLGAPGDASSVPVAPGARIFWPRVPRGRNESSDSPRLNRPPASRNLYIDGASAPRRAPCGWPLPVRLPTLPDLDDNNVTRPKFHHIQRDGIAVAGTCSGLSTAFVHIVNSAADACLPTAFVHHVNPAADNNHDSLYLPKRRDPRERPIGTVA